MAGTESTSSSLTSTSHTLTNAPAGGMASAGAGDGSALAVFLDFVSPTNRHVFLQPPPSLPTGSLQLAKETLDALAGQVSDQQQVRLRELGKKRKRELGIDRNAILKIRRLHIDGFDTNQIWQQAKKIISSALAESSEVLQELEENNEVAKNGAAAKPLEFGKDGFEVESDEDGSASASSDQGSEADSEESDEGSSDVSDEEEDEGEDEEDDEMVDGELSEGEEGVGVEDEEDEGEEEDEEVEASEEFQEDPDGLNDGFFSLKEFNKQSQWFEAQDARADPNTDNIDDDESVDWHADPMDETAVKGMAAGEEDMDDESDIDMDGEDDFDKEEEDAPSFGKLKKGASSKASREEPEEDGDGDDLGLSEMDLTANDIYYKDFFAPPPKKSKPGSKRKPFKFSQPAKPDDADIERAENDVRRDLFEDMSEYSDSEDALSDASAGNPKSRRSAHERRQAKVAEEIRKLESELVAKRAWTLSGEAKATDRPVNSLLEEDLDFEHVGKPVPVITEEVSESIEALIKRRILAQEFDELLRRRPDTLLNPNGARRGLVDIEDTKGKQSLAEIYEEEHTKNVNPDAYVSQSDDKLKKDEEEIKQMWKDISGKLDALSSWHYKPKPAAPTLTIVADVATVSMEDAQPTTAQGVAGGESMIAPQEVYAPGKESTERGEIVAKSGLPIAKQEMSREDKVRRRRREKERIRKAGGVDANKPMTRGAQARKETMGELKKGGVKVINRKGEVMGLDGKKTTEQAAVTSSSRFKL
ncbi:Mpp10 protein-domain-containing protein [Apodospora peruviana]|uniref:U3 small nucleolar ribonucleoprotein protein MPP10 n=1 Tax=Apodospora peruviana TaxID=516989 RepID=A0AAE0I177_9PEZI|nr:Mpp10 protein-domain-containing protein [Apodospora peruviana]